MTEKQLRSGRSVHISDDSEQSDAEAAPKRRYNAKEAAKMLLQSSQEDRRITRSQKRSSTEVVVDADDYQAYDPLDGSNQKAHRRKVAKKHTPVTQLSFSESVEDGQEPSMDQATPEEPVDGQEKPFLTVAKRRSNGKPKRMRKPPATITPADMEQAEKDKKKRLEYLLKQSELFAHVMTSGGAEQATVAKKGKKRKQPGDPSSSSEPTDHRHARKAGSEEDKIDEEPKMVHRFEKTPFYIGGGEMRDYQVRGLNWLITLCENGINGILADEMGLGKTLQTIALLGYMQNVKNCDLPHLIIVPKSTLSNWMNEFHRWCPSMVVTFLKGDQDERNLIIKETKKERTWDVLITSYEIVLREQSFLRKYPWGYIVVDEAHRIKNEEAKLSVAVRTFNSSRRLLLTGTPLQNNLHELWALLNFLLPDIFESAQDFDSWFDDSACVKDMGLIDRLHSILRPFLLRRVKSDVEKDLPSKTEIKLFVGLTPMQRTWYRNILLKDISVLNSVHGVGSSALHNVLMHLRKCCNHPYLFEGAEPGPPYTTDRHLVDNCGKMILLHKLLPRLKEAGSKVLIFSQMTRVLDILEDYCVWIDYQYCRLDGNTAHEDREEAIRDFSAPNSQKFLFLLSTRAGGLGINLTAADTVILYDSDWNPQVDLQAMDRVHRIGQTRPVTIFRLITENTVEERIIERAEKKLHLDAMVIQSGRLVDVAKGLGKEEIMKMIRYGAQSIIHSDVDNITDEDIDTILAKGKAKTEELNKKFSDLTEENLRGLTNDFVEKETDTYHFEGQDYRGKGQQSVNAKVDDLEKNWIALPKRQRRQLYDLSGTASGTAGRESPPWNPNQQKPVKRPSIPRPAMYRFIDVHFPPPRLIKLLEREQLAYKKAINFKVDIDMELPEDVHIRQVAEQAKIDAAEPLTPEEEQEKRDLLNMTFHSWRRNDVLSLLRGLELFGPSDPEKIAKSVPHKTVDEVKAYLEIFLAKFHTLVDASKIRARINKGIAKQERQKRSREAVQLKMAGCLYPEMEIKIPYPNGYHKIQQQGTGLRSAGNAPFIWLEEADRFLLCAYDGASARFPDDTDDMFEAIRDAIRQSSRFRFDFLMRSVTTERIKDRLDILLTWLVREAFPSLLRQPVTNFLTQNYNGSANQEQVEPSSSASSIPTPQRQLVATAFSAAAIFHRPASEVAVRPDVQVASGSQNIVQLPATQSKSFTLKYIDSKAGKFVTEPPNQDVPSTSQVCEPIIILDDPGDIPSTSAKSPSSDVTIISKKPASDVVVPAVFPRHFSEKKSAKKSDGARKDVPSWAAPRLSSDSSLPPSLQMPKALRVKKSTPSEQGSSSGDSEIQMVYVGKSLHKKISDGQEAL